RRHAGPASQRDDTLPEAAQEPPPARPLGEGGLRGLEGARLAHRRRAACVLCSAVCTSPSTCSIVLTVPLARTAPSSSRTSTNGVPGTSNARSASGSWTI